ncbi:hypothetical protein G5V58_24585 [Nocardioides anomalus]|uniref:Tat pathway signal sequence domain protein n=1 Tax=Nocardioides anomalus TaxID=2712223 RepID=A0A6G6WJI8_9ACTN|nr:hypothetical protein [Nocardioides anomalus]QIG45501.1 hypothetical protein G5V58_24585 [Nocardioides anomalus]
MILRATALLAGTALVAALALAAAAPAHARAADLPVRASDPAGDVVVFDGGGTKPTTGQRTSIDLRSFSAVERGDGVRFSFTIARIVAGRTFDQVVAVSFGRDAFQLLANPQQKKGTAVGAAICSVDVSTTRATGTVRVDVPDRCLPDGAGVLRVSAYLQKKNGSGPGFSEDTLRVPGQVSLH